MTNKDRDSRRAAGATNLYTVKKKAGQKRSGSILTIVTCRAGPTVLCSGVGLLTGNTQEYEEGASYVCCLQMVTKSGCAGHWRATHSRLHAELVPLFWGGSAGLQHA